ncbi:MAG: phosphoenolpyruvate--protein phosphotransferase [Phycisphaerae bacterium]
MARQPRDHMGLLCDVGDLAARLAGSADLRAFLDQIVQIVAEQLHSDVCSIYMFDDRTSQLVLRATKGLNARHVDQLRLDLGEGLCGLAMQELRAVREDRASANPNFRAVPGINEEPYESFLAVPIRKGIERLGVLVVQREKTRGFDAHDERAMGAIAAQLASAIENARILLRFQSSDEEPETADGPVDLPALVHGAVACEGFAYGPAAVHDSVRSRISRSQIKDDTRYTLEQFESALERTGQQLQELQARMGQRLPEMASLIFDAHLMMLNDPHFGGEMAEGIRDGENALAAIVRVGEKYAGMLEESTHAYMREKAQDVRDLLRRLMANLTGDSEDVALAGEGVVIARELYPSDMLKLASAGAGGVVLVSGGITSHVSILARSLKLPMIIAEDDHLLSLPPGTPVLLNTETGGIYIDPAEHLVDQFRARNEASRAVEADKDTVKPRTRTADGTRVKLLANINLLSELPLARDVKAEGVGLYRSEFPFLVRADMPSEQEQVMIYSRLMENSDGKVVTFRTLDLGGDKLLAYYDTVGEENPTMGLRSIRFTLRHRDVFETQLRAILQAGAGADLQIMFPMISSVDEFVLARRIVRECIEQLTEQDIECHQSPKIGLMVEVPSAVAMVDALAEEADFLCVGTNDLTQFLLAVDRTNEKVAGYFSSHHPAVLRALQRIADAGRAAGVDVSICGELAHEPIFLPFLLGVGMHTLSVDPQFLPRIQQRIETMEISQCCRHARAVLKETTVEGVAKALGMACPVMHEQDDPSAMGEA